MRESLSQVLTISVISLSADGVRQSLTWKGASALPEFPVRLRFRLTNAKLYAFWIDEDY